MQVWLTPNVGRSSSQTYPARPGDRRFSMPFRTWSTERHTGTTTSDSTTRWRVESPPCNEAAAARQDGGRSLSCASNLPEPVADSVPLLDEGRTDIAVQPGLHRSLDGALIDHPH